MADALIEIALKAGGMEAPRLETDRLALRGRTLADAPALAAMWGDPRVTQEILQAPEDAAAAWGRFLRLAGHWAAMGFGYWVVEEKASGAVIGEVGFGEFKRPIEPPIFGEPEIGWVFAADAHGKGYATEAARAAIAWGDLNFRARTMSCIIAPGHAPSIRVAEKCGFVEAFRSTMNGKPLVALRRAIPK